MRVVILSARTGWHTDELTRALTERGHLAAVVPYEGLTATSTSRRVFGNLGRLAGSARRPASTSEGQISVLDADAVLARIIPGGSLEQLIFRVDALHWIENRGVRVVNSPRTIERSVNKFYTTTLLHDAGLPVPETVVCERAEDAMAAVRAMGDVVIKPIFGSLGHGMVRVSDPETALRVVRALEQIRSVFYVQRAIDHGGRDLRVFVVGGRVIGAIERRAPEGDWRTNVAIGGMATAVRVDPDVERVALARCRGRRRRLCRCGRAAGSRRVAVRARGQRHPWLAGAAACDRHRRGRRRSSSTSKRCVQRGTSSERPEEPMPA